MKIVTWFYSAIGWFLSFFEIFPQEDLEPQHPVETKRAMFHRHKYEHPVLSFDKNSGTSTIVIYCECGEVKK